jgi:hypothetical protein
MAYAIPGFNIVVVLHDFSLILILSLESPGTDPKW